MKKSLSGSNTLYLLASGGLILYVISRLFRKKEAIPKVETGYRPSPLLPSSTSVSFDEIYQLLRKEEGIDYTARVDGKDKEGNTLYAIGIGHQIQLGEENLFTARITEDEAILLFQKDIDKILKDMNKNIQVPLNKNQQLALISLRYRIGPNYFNESTLLKELNKGNFQKASEEFKNWRLSGGQVVNGLVLRAERERIRFLTPPSSTGIYSPPPIAPIGSSNFPLFIKGKSSPVEVKKPESPPFTFIPTFPFILPKI